MLSSPVRETIPVGGPRLPYAFVRVPATRSESVAAIVIAILVAVAVAVIPNPRLVVGILPGFYPLYATVLIASESVVASLLLWRSELDRDRRIAVLGAAYLFSAILTTANVMTLPGLLAPRGMFGVQTPVYLLVAFHLFWPFGVLVFAVMPQQRHHGAARAIVGAALAGVAALLVGIHADAWLPPLVVPGTNRYAPLFEILMAIAAALEIAAVVSIVRRKPTSFELWIAVAVILLMGDTFLNIDAGSRFTLGQYAARLLTLGSSMLVFVALIGEYLGLLTRASVVDRYAAIAGSAPNILFLEDALGRCTYVNARWTELTGQPGEEARGTGYRDAIHPEDVARLERPAKRTGERPAAVVELRIRDEATGRFRWHLMRTTQLLDRQGRFEAWLSTATDIDDQYVALENANAAEREFRNIADAIPQLVWTADARGRFDWANANWHAFMGGRARARDYEFAWSGDVHPHDRAEVEARWRTALRDGEKFDMEFRLRGADGAYRWFLTRVVPFRGPGGEIARWYGTDTDVDERRRQSDELVAMYERQHHVAQALQAAFLPPFLPEIDGLVFDAVYRPAARDTEVGGDWYDAFALADGRIAISIGDVTGHGLEAAVAMVRVRELLRAATAMTALGPGEVLAVASRALAAGDVGVLASAAFGIVDMATGTFTYATAGHPPPLLRRDSVVTALAGGGLLLGLEDASPPVHAVALETGDVLAFYTDGLTEIDRADLELGERRLQEELVRHGADATRIVDALVSSEPRDDVALLTVAVAAFATRGGTEPNWKFVSDDARTAQAARSSFVAYLESHGVRADMVVTAEVVFGELVGNVVRHAPGPIDVELAWNAGAALLVVRDRGAGFALDRARLPESDYAESGRGLFIVDAYANPPSVRARRGGGTAVEVRLALGIESDA